MLRLSASGFFSKERVELSNANVSGQADQAQLRFSLRAGFAADASLSTRTSLPSLGAEGMARRIAVLVQEGLVK